MLRWHNGPSVIIDDGKQWQIYTATFDCDAISGEFPELDITPDEASEIVERLLGRIEEDMYEYMEDWLLEVRSSDNMVVLY